MYLNTREYFRELIIQSAKSLKQKNSKIKCSFFMWFSFDLLIKLAVFEAIFSTRLECSFNSCPPVSSVVLHLLHSFRVYFFPFKNPPTFFKSYRFKSTFFNFFQNVLDWGQIKNRNIRGNFGSDFLYSFRVYFHIFPTRFECIFTSSHSFRV